MSPQLDHDSTHPSLVDIPLADRAIACLSHKLYVLQLRRNGNWHRLARARLRDCAFPPASLSISTHAERQTKLVVELLSMGAEAHLAPVREDEPATANVTAGNILAALPAGWRYLSHCTRRCDGPWPDSRPIHETLAQSFCEWKPPPGVGRQTFLRFVQRLDEESCEV